MEKKVTLKEIKQRSIKSSKSKSRTPEEKRQDKIDKLENDPKLWKFLEHLINEDVYSLNKSYLKFRMIYQSGRRFSGKEWIELMSDLLDEIN